VAPYAPTQRLELREEPLSQLLVEREDPPVFAAGSAEDPIGLRDRFGGVLSALDQQVVRVVA
jgi:hypothetical protein